MELVRSFVGVAGYDRSAHAVAVRASLEASRTRDDLADIVNAAIEELVRHRYELPAFGTLLKIARTARACVNRGCHRRVAAAMTPETRERLSALLVVPDGAVRSPWDQVKAEPLRPSPQRMARVHRPPALAAGPGGRGLFAGIPTRSAPVRGRAKLLERRSRPSRRGERLSALRARSRQSSTIPPRRPRRPRRDGAARAHATEARSAPDGRRGAPRPIARDTERSTRDGARPAQGPDRVARPLSRGLLLPTP